MYYRDAEVGLLVYDITVPSTFEALNSWVQGAPGQPKAREGVLRPCSQATVLPLRAWAHRRAATRAAGPNRFVAEAVLCAPSSAGRPCSLRACGLPVLCIRAALCVVGNKADLADRRAVTEAEARAYAGTINAAYFEVSAKDDIGTCRAHGGGKLAHALTPRWGPRASRRPERRQGSTSCSWRLAAQS